MAISKDMMGKVALVTGAGQGMGKAVALKLAAQGASLVVNDLDERLAKQTTENIIELGAQAFDIRADISMSTEVNSMVDSALKRYQDINILVNAAGIVRPTPVIDMEEEEWDAVLSVNLKGTYLCSRAVLSVMQKAGWGRIINFSSTAGKSTSTIGGAHYTASKAGVLGFTRHLAKESASYGITVNSVCPGLIDTEMVRSTISLDRIKAYASGFPVSRLGNPGEVAELVAFLASDKASYITGASLDINGGDLTI
jgi:3-oxoacyl-[acyl-carrier protein] reductase